MRIGKLDNSELERLILRKFSKTRKETLTGPAIGEDCAMLDLGDDLIALSTDPITSSNIENLGRLSVYVNCNDAICSGAEPVGLLVTLLAPPCITEDEIERVALDLARCAREYEVDILGGHTEITDAVTRAITSSTVIARKPRSFVLRGAREGDYIVMTKYAGLEGTAILASDYPLCFPALTSAELEEAAGCFDSLSIAKEAGAALKEGASALHDVTEGGVLGAAWELAERFKLGAVIKTAAIPVLPVTKKLCACAGIDPLRLIGSGSLLIATDSPLPLIQKLQKMSLNACVIGRLSSGGFTDEDGSPIEPPEADELYHFASGRQAAELRDF
ncbi:MAG: AIR synthase family protein [Clostridia bacterium]|nr:AIR synthase family protein [Clostridia bacterium]